MLVLLADGLPNKVIARRLGIAEKTVKAHVTQIFQAHRRHGPHAGGAVGRSPGALVRRSQERRERLRGRTTRS